MNKIKFFLIGLFAIACFAASASSQTPVPISWKLELPSSCAFDINSKTRVLVYKYGTSGSGQGLYYCSAANTWTKLGGAGLSGGDLKTINSTSLVGAGNITVQAPLVSGTNIKTVNGNNLLGAGNVAVQDPLVSGTNVKTINGQSVLGSGNLDVTGVVESLVANVTEMDALITTANSNPTILYTTQLKGNAVVSSAKTIPANIVLENLNGAKFTKSGSGTIVFQGVGLINPESQTALFSGFAAGDVTFSGTAPARLSSALWDDASLSVKVENAIGAVAGKAVTIVAYPGTGAFTKKVTLTTGLDLHLRKGTYANTIGTVVAGREALFILQDNTRVYGDGMTSTIIEESSNDNIRIFYTDGFAYGAFDGTNSNIEISDLQIKGHPGTAVYSAFSAIALGNVKNGHVRRVYFNQSHGFGAYLGGFGTSGYFSEYSSVTDCVFNGLQTQQTGSLNGRNLIFARNTFVNYGLPGGPSLAVIDLEPNSDTDIMENVQVVDNVFDGRNSQVTAGAIVVQAAGAAAVKNIRVAGNIIIGADNYPTQGLTGTEFDAATDRINVTGHGYLNTSAVALTTSGTLPGGLSGVSTYYVISVNANSFKLALSYANALAGTAVDITAAAGSGTHNVIPFRNLSSGISISGGDNVTVENNQIRGTGSAAISIDNSTGVIAQNNAIRLSGGGGNHPVQILGVSNSYIERNRIFTESLPVSQSDEIFESEITMSVNTTSGSPTVTRVSGAIPRPFWVGKTVTINAVDYVVKSVAPADANSFTLTTNAASTLSGTTLTTKGFSSNRYTENKTSNLTRSSTGTSKEYSRVGGFYNADLDGSYQVNGLKVLSHNNASGFVAVNEGGVASSTRIYGDPVFLANNLLTKIDGTGKLVFDAATPAIEASAGDVVLRTTAAGKVVRMQGVSNIDRQIVGVKKTLTDATDVNLFEVALPTLTGTGGTIDVTIFAADGTDVQTRSQVVRYEAVNKGGTYTATINVASEGAAPSAGTLTGAWTILTGTNKITIRLNADTSLTPTTFYVIYTLKNQSEQGVTLL